MFRLTFAFVLALTFASTAGAETRFLSTLEGCRLACTAGGIFTCLKCRERDRERSELHEGVRVNHLRQALGYAGIKTRKHDGDTSKMLTEGTQKFQRYLGETVGGELTRDQVAVLIEVGRVYQCQYQHTGQTEAANSKPRYHVLDQVLSSGMTREEMYRPDALTSGPFGVMRVKEEFCAE